MTPHGWTGTAAVLADRIAAFIDASLADEPTEDFGALALDVHAWQRQNDPILAKLAGVPSSWRDIPAVSVELFKHVRVGTIGRGLESVEFLTSGTTGGGRGAHFMRSTWLYDKAAVGWARKQLPEAPSDVVALLEDPILASESSLSHMVDLFKTWTTPAGEASWHVYLGRLNHQRLNERIKSADRPLFVATTAFALAEWLEAEPARLPSGSYLMVTGGLKGRSHSFEGDTLYALARERLGPLTLVTEYGMTELSSQLWGTPDQPYAPPPWLRVLAVDPHTGSARPAGSRGQLRFLDLANLDGTLVIDTLDEGTVHEDGRVTLHGRLAGSPARGCSLSIEESWDR